MLSRYCVHVYDSTTDIIMANVAQVRNVARISLFFVSIPIINLNVQKEL